MGVDLPPVWAVPQVAHLVKPGGALAGLWDVGDEADGPLFRVAVSRCRPSELRQVLALHRHRGPSHEHPWPSVNARGLSLWPHAAERVMECPSRVDSVDPCGGVCGVVGVWVASLGAPCCRPSQHGPRSGCAAGGSLSLGDHVCPHGLPHPCWLEDELLPTCLLDGHRREFAALGSREWGVPPSQGSLVRVDQGEHDRLDGAAARRFLHPVLVVAGAVVFPFVVGYLLDARQH